MRDYIEIDKELLPCNFDIELAGEEFNIEIFYNSSADLFTATLSKGEEILCYHEPILYGVELFKDVYISGKFPMISIVPLDQSGEEKEITWDNFGETVLLTIDNEPESGGEDGK